MYIYVYIYILMVQDIRSRCHKFVPVTHKGGSEHRHHPRGPVPSIGDDPEMRHDSSCGRCNMKVPWAKKKYRVPFSGSQKMDKHGLF